MPTRPSSSVRKATSGDAEAIMAIYNSEVTETTNTFDLVPRSLGDQLTWLEGHFGAHPAIVATLGPDVVGFGALSPYRDRPAYSTTVENSVYVTPRHRGQKIGSLLLENLIGLAVEHGFHTIIARIVGNNDASIGLHQRHGFELVGVEKEVGRKHRQWLDVVELQLLLSS